jgi:hypothetical protein
MPINCFHRGNTREGDDDRRDLAARDALLQHLLLNPHAVKETHFNHLAVKNPDLGKCEPLNPLCADNDGSQRPAEKDLTTFIEDVLSPMFLLEIYLLNSVGEEHETEGFLEALLIFLDQVLASHLHVRPKMAAASSVEEVMRQLEEKIRARFEPLTPPKDAPLLESQLHALGPDWPEELKDRIAELINRARGAPGRAATLPAFKLFHEDLSSNISRSLGDVFIYLKELGSGTGLDFTIVPILKTRAQVPKRHHEEPLIVLIHTVGSTILSDILTHYAPDGQVDTWISAASTVGQFEEMKRLKARESALKAHSAYFTRTSSSQREEDPLERGGYDTYYR